MLDDIDQIIWKTLDGDDIRIVCKNVIQEDRSPELLYYKKFQFEILNQHETLMGIFEIDKNTLPDWVIYFDEGEVDTESYGFARKWIITQCYNFINTLIYHQFATTLNSDRTSISFKMSQMRQKLVSHWKAEFLWYNEIWQTYFDGKIEPTPMFRMLPPAE